MEFLKDFIKKENVKLLESYFKAKTTAEKIEILKKIRENNEFLYINEKVKGGRI